MSRQSAKPKPAQPKPAKPSRDALAAAIAAAEEEKRRREVRRSLTAWARYKGFEPAPHHMLIINELESFLASDDEVLLLHAPPGSAKSTYVSVLFPSWYLSQYPQNNILFSTHSVDFAQRWGRRVRNDIATDGDALGITMSPTNAASDRWALQEGGEYYAVGAGTGISGFRADLGLCDDLFGSREDAWSELVRNKRWDWYVDDFGHRMKPKAKRVLMNTRWHEDDVAGRIVRQIEAGTVKGKIINIPAIAHENDAVGRQPGEYLWDDPQGYDYASFLRSRQRESTPMMWSALFQQEPTPDDGDYFKVEWLKEHVELPKRETLKVYGASDYAVTASGGDYTVHIVVGIDSEGRPWVLDLWRGQTDSSKWIDKLCDLILEYRPVEWAEETGQIKSAVGPFIDKRCAERGAYVYRRQFAARGDKAVRAQGIRGVMAMRGLHVQKGAEWYPTLRSELLRFPAGKHDDQVDALGLIGQVLDASTTIKLRTNNLFVIRGGNAWMGG
jgi:predicted phage terminase large subunit-like protein